MSERDPVSADPMIAGATTPTPWARARAILEEAPATYWLATVRPNGAPTAAFGFGIDETFVPTRWRFGEPTT